MFEPSCLTLPWSTLTPPTSQIFLFCFGLLRQGEHLLISPESLQCQVSHTLLKSLSLFSKRHTLCIKTHKRGKTERGIVGGRGWAYLPTQPKVVLCDVCRMRCRLSILVFALSLINATSELCDARDAGKAKVCFICEQQACKSYVYEHLPWYSILQHTQVVIVISERNRSPLR